MKIINIFIDIDTFNSLNESLIEIANIKCYEELLHIVKETNANVIVKYNDKKRFILKFDEKTNTLVQI